MVPGGGEPYETRIFATSPMVERRNEILLSLPFGFVKKQQT